MEFVVNLFVLSLSKVYSAEIGAGQFSRAPACLQWDTAGRIPAHGRCVWKLRYSEVLWGMPSFINIEINIDFCRLIIYGKILFVDVCSRAVLCASVWQPGPEAGSGGEDQRTCFVPCPADVWLQGHTEGSGVHSLGSAGHCKCTRFIASMLIQLLAEDHMMGSKWLKK